MDDGRGLPYSPTLLTLYINDDNVDNIESVREVEELEDDDEIELEPARPPLRRSPRLNSGMQSTWIFNASVKDLDTASTAEDSCLLEGGRM